MKRKFTLFSMLIAFAGLGIAQQGNIMNGDFENWSNVTLYDYPDQWGSSNTEEWRGVPGVEKSTDASVGNASVKLNCAVNPNNDTIFGYVYQGSIGSNGPDGGIAYTSVFDEVTFDYKSSLATGDTLNMIMIRFVNGTMVDMQLKQAAVGTHTAWTSGSISVPATVQDELFIGFIMGNPFSQVLPKPGAWALVDNLVLKNASVAATAIPDYSFESWSTQSYEGPDDWYTLNDILVGIGSTNANKTTNSHTGTYAVELTTIQEPNNNDTIPGFVSMGPINLIGSNGSPFLPLPYDANPTTFTGAYDYTPSNNDMGGIIYLEFYKNGSSVGQHSEYLSATSGYQTFTASLSLTMTPDSVVLIAGSGNNPGSVLLVDNLALSGGNVSVFENDLEIEMYPNPASDYFIMNIDEEYSYEIYSMEGRRVGNKTGLLGWESVDVSSLASGKYMVKINTAGKTINKALIVE